MATIIEPAPTSNRAVAVRVNQPLRLRADTAWNWFVRTNEGGWTQFATGTLEAFRTMATSVTNRQTFDRVEIAIGSGATPDTSTTRYFDLCEGPPAVLWATGRMENEALSEPPGRPWEGEDDDPPLGTPWAMPPADRTGFGTTLGETVSERNAGPANLFASWGPGVFVDTSGGLGVRTPFTNDARGLGPFPAVAAWYQGGLYFEHDFGKARNLALTRVLYEESGAPNNVAIVRGDGRRNTYRLSGGVYTGAAGIRNTLTKSGGVFTETTPSGRVYRYSSAGRLERVVDRVGNPVYFSYDVNSRLQRIDGLPGQDATGLVPYFTYNASGLLEKLQLQDGTTPANTRESYFTYDGNKNLLRIIGPESCITYFEYNPATRLQAVTDPEGFRWYFAYDANGRVERVLDGLGKPTYFSWTPAAALGAKVDRAGTITYFRWGPFGSPEYVYNRGTSADYFRYDGDGNLVGSRTRLGREWYYQYDSQANRISVTDPLNGRAYFAYDAQSLLRTYVDQLGRPTYMTYDGQRNREQWTDAVGGTAYYSYEGTGLLRQKKDRRGAITYMQWDSRANVTRVVDPLQNTTYFAYNSANERTAQEDPLQRVSYFEYDKRGRQTQAIDPAGAPTYWAYDARCNLVLQRDARMNATTYQYDGNSNRTKVTDALSNVTYFAYEPEEKPSLHVNARGNPTYWTYDALGRRQRQVDAYGGVTYFGYTTEHLFNLGIDARNNPTYFFHDRVGRQTHEKNALMREAYLGYDLAGQRVLSRDRRSFSTYLQYDPRGWLRRTETAVGAATYMAFDAEGNRERVVDPRGFAAYYTYDLAGRLTHTKDPLGGVTYAGYDRASQRVLALDQLSQPTYFRFDPAGRQSHVTNALFQTTYMGYDLVGNAVQTLLPSEADAIYWTDATGGAQAIKRCRPDGSGLTTLVSSGLSVPRGIEVDLAGGKMYWVDSGNDTIKRANLDGSSVETLVSTGLSTPRGLRLDVAAGHMYWVDSGNDTIKRANMADGSGVTTVLSTDLTNPQGLALDLSARKMYWTDATEQTVKRANLDGTSVETLVSTGISAPNEIDLDTFSGQMYWVDSGTDTIKRANMADGSDVVTLVSGLTTPRGLRLDLAARVMYFVDPGTSKLQRANLDGSNVTDILTSGIAGPEDMALEIPSRVTTRAYDPLNRLLRTTDAYGAQTYMAYDQVGNVERSLDPRGFATYFTYDRLDRRTHAKDPVHFASTYMGYDEVGNVVAQVDQQGATTYLTYDRANQVYFTFDRAGARTYFAYDANGNRVSTQVLFGANRRSTYFDYDPASRLLQQTAADGGITYYQLDLAGNRERLVEPAYPGFGFPSYYVYDGLNRQTCRYNQLLEKTYLEYDARSSQTRQIDPVGRATYMAYDALQRLTRQSNALGEFSYFAYDARGNRVATTNPRGYSTYFRFDLLDRQTHRTDALGGVSYVAYDAAGNRVQASDELGQTTYFTLDGLNRLTHSKDQLAAVTYLAYDNRSAVVMRRDADGRASYMAYDTAGRMSRQHYKNPVAGEAATAPSYFVYDEVNDLRIVDDTVGGLGITYFDYDAMDRVVKKVTNTGALYYSYDLGGRKRTLKDRSFNENYYLYDGAARLSWEVLDNGNTAYFLYDASGLRTRKRHPDTTGGTPLVTYTSYDGAGRVSRIENGTAGFVQADLTYRRLPGGLVAQITYSDNSHTYFDYDALDRLVKEETKNKFSSATVYGFRYAYDAVGNRTNKSTFGPSTSEAYYTYNALNLVTRERVQPANADTYYRYDSAQRMLEGRTTEAGGQSTYFSHDQLGRVTAIDFASSGGADGARAFSYNGVGERVTVVDGSTTEWQHDGKKLILERFSGGGPDARRYRHNQGDQGMGSVVQIYSLPDAGPDLMYPGFDERGTVRLVLTSGLVGEYWTDRFGVPLAEKSNFPEVASQRLRFLSPAMLRLGTNNQRFYLTPGGVYVPQIGRTTSLALALTPSLWPRRLWFALQEDEPPGPKPQNPPGQGDPAPVTSPSPAGKGDPAPVTSPTRTGPFKPSAPWDTSTLVDGGSAPNIVYKPAKLPECDKFCFRQTVQVFVSTNSPPQYRAISEAEYSSYMAYRRPAELADDPATPQDETGLHIDFVNQVQDMCGPNIWRPGDPLPPSPTFYDTPETKGGDKGFKTDANPGGWTAVQFRFETCLLCFKGETFQILDPCLRWDWTMTDADAAAKRRGTARFTGQGPVSDQFRRALDQFKKGIVDPDATRRR